MSEFLTGADLDNAICDTIWDAEETLLIVSPYIKLDDYFKKLFDKHENNPRIHLIIVFGKNEKSVKKSMSKTDFVYFKKFLNVSIIYVPNLHAKYYGNETQGVISSINLYDFSFKNNIEFGVFSKVTVLDRFKHSPDNDAWNECQKIAESNEVVYIKRPVYESRKLIVNLTKNFVSSKVLLDSTDKFYGFKFNNDNKFKTLKDFPDELEVGSATTKRPSRNTESISNENGFCIRTGDKIDFNPKQPLCKEAWLVWNQYQDEDFPENYCHKTGKKSHGRTSMRNPILKSSF